MLNEKKSKRSTVIALLCALALLALVVLLENTMKPTGMLFTVLKKGAVYALVAVSMNLLNGFTGLFSLGQAGFMLLGAYTYAILTIPTADREAVYYLYNGSAVNFSLPELVKIWSPEGISKSPAIFDPLKLRAINAEYIRRLSPEEFQKKAEPWIDSAVHSAIDKKLLCANLQPRCEVLGEIPEQLDFFDAMPEYDVSLYANKKQKTTPETAKEALEALLPVLSDEALDFGNRDAVFDACKAKAEELGKKNGWLLYPLGIALSGKQRTPGGGTDLACMMGREKTLQRVQDAIAKLNG